MGEWCGKTKTIFGLLIIICALSFSFGFCRAMWEDDYQDLQTRYDHLKNSYLVLNSENQELKNNITLCKYNFATEIFANENSLSVLKDAKEELTSCYNENTRLRVENVYLDYRIPDFMKIAYDVANSYTYNSTFRCVQFSEELVNRLRNAGYDAQAVYGVTKNGVHHAWTKIYGIEIESTNGNLISPLDDFYIRQ